MAITSTGLGSGLDINAIVTAIVGAEKDPALAKMLQTQASATAMISAYGMLNSELSTFKDSYKALSYASSFTAASYSSSDKNILGATVGVGAVPGEYEFEVLQRAQAQALVSSSANAFKDPKDPVGTGEISFSYGSYNAEGKFEIDPDKPVEKLTIDSSNNSLSGMRDAINDGDYSVSASIINDGENYRMVLTNKETGEESAMQINVADEDGNNADGGGLSRFAYNDTVKNMDESSKAQDSKIIMNGITITRDSNQITNVIEGVTLDLKGETKVGEKVTIKVEQDTSKVEEQINAFVENYNKTIVKMNELTSSTSGVLNGDSTIRGIQSSLRNVLNTQVGHIEGSVKSFADLGMLTNRDGTLSLDSAKLKELMKTDMEGIAEFFTAAGSTSDSEISFDSSSALTKPGTYDVEVTQLATQGNLTGSTVNNLTIDENNNTFKIRIDGHLSEEITLDPKAYGSVEELAKEMQSKINSDPNFVKSGVSVNVADDGGKLSFTSEKYGSESTVAFTEVDTNFLADLGLDVQGGTTGLNVEGFIDGKLAMGDGQFLLAESGDATGIRLLIEGGELGPRGTVTFTEGISTVMNNALTSIIDTNISSTEGDLGSSNGMIDTKIDSLYKKMNGIDDQKESLLYRMDKMEARLYKDFNAMDIAVANLNNTMSYLKSTLDALPGYTRD